MTFHFQKTETFTVQKSNGKRYYTGLQVTKDPGVWVVYSGFITMILGIIITFFMSHQRLYVEVGLEGKKSKVMVAGTAPNSSKAASCRRMTLWRVSSQPKRT